jgi:hypothetical protein
MPRRLVSSQRCGNSQQRKEGGGRKPPTYPHSYPQPVDKPVDDTPEKFVSAPLSFRLCLPMV